jgi:uncharacterized protein YfaT (DUF1175 family)
MKQLAPRSSGAPAGVDLGRRLGLVDAGLGITLLGGGGWAAAAQALGTTATRGAGTGAAAPDADPPRLDAEQSQRFRAWMTRLIHTQIEQGPTPRWLQRDCAGLVRFAVAEALREHDLAWKRANGLLGQRLPPDVDSPAAAPLRHAWRRVDGSRAAWVGALELVQENTRPVARQLQQAEPGDLLFYDFGDDQHLMVWMGRYIAYHTGQNVPGDNGLRALRPEQLQHWRDTRWRPSSDNPNFTGVHRLAFLTR